MEEEAIVKEQEEGYQRRHLSTNIRSSASWHFDAPAPDLATNFCRVRRLWRPLEYPELRPVLPPTFDLLRRGSPVLVTVHNDFCTFFDPVYDVACRTVIPTLIGARLRVAMHEWLLLTRPPSEIFFYNLSTGIKVQLPPYPEALYESSQMCISAPPDSSDCLVIMIDTSIAEDTVSFIRLGETRWTIYENWHSSIWPTCNPVVHKGKLYSLGNKGCLIELNFDGPGYQRRIVAKQPKPLVTWRHRSIEPFLMEKDGELLAIFVKDNEVRVNVFAQDTPTRWTWRGVQSFKDEMLFVSRGSSFLEKAAVRGTENRVYITKTGDDRGVFYSFATKQFHALSHGFPIRDPRTGKEGKQSCAWVRVHPDAPRYKKRLFRHR